MRMKLFLNESVECQGERLRTGKDVVCERLQGM